MNTQKKNISFGLGLLGSGEEEVELGDRFLLKGILSISGRKNYNRARGVFYARSECRQNQIGGHRN